MATTNEFRDYIVESLSRCGAVSARKMMGEYLLYFEGKLVGDICDNCLYLKQTPTACRLLPDAELGYPYEGSKTLMLMIPDVADDELMGEVLRAMITELPDAKAKKKK